MFVMFFICFHTAQFFMGLLRMFVMFFICFHTGQFLMRFICHAPLARGVVLVPDTLRIARRPRRG